MRHLRIWHFVGIPLVSCLLRSGQDKRGVADKTVGEWIGREIVFSDGVDCFQKGKDMEARCFLLDRENKVLAIGNPTLNPNLWGLYKSIITGEADKPAIGKSNARAP